MFKKKNKKKTFFQTKISIGHAGYTYLSVFCVCLVVFDEGEQSDVTFPVISQIIADILAWSVTFHTTNCI